MAVKPKKLLADSPETLVAAKRSEAGLPNQFSGTAINCPIACDIPIYNIRWYPSSKSCVKISTPHRKPQNTPPLMVRKAEWRR